MAYYPIATSFEAIYKLTSNSSVSAVFNDPLDPEYVGALTEVTGLDSPEIRESAFDLTEADGGQHGYFYFGRRPVVLSGTVFGHTSVAERTARLDRARRASQGMLGNAALTWKPRVRLENLIANPRAQNSTTLWSTTGTLTAVTGVAPPVGTTGFQLVTSGSGATNQGATNGAALRAGTQTAVSWSYIRTAGTGTAEIYVTGPAGFTPVTLFSNLSSGTWTTLTSTFTPTVTGVYTFAFRQPSSNTLASTFQFSNVMVSPGTVTTYRDGDTAGWYWQANPGDTTSGDFIELILSVRRQQPFREAGGWVKTFQIPLVSAAAVIENSGLKTAAFGVDVENRGNYPAYPRFDITGPSTDPTVTIGGTVFRTTGLTLASGETAQFDMLLHTGKFTAGVRNGQSANRYINWATTAWPSITGNGFPIFPSTLAGGGSGLVRYKDAWV